MRAKTTFPGALGRMYITIISFGSLREISRRREISRGQVAVTDESRLLRQKLPSAQVGSRRLFDRPYFHHAMRHRAWDG